MLRAPSFDHRALFFGVAALAIAAGLAPHTSLAQASPSAKDRTGAEIVQAQCVKCHETGVNGAPKIGDQSAWIPRMKTGLDNTVRSAIKGHGVMPARGGMADLTDAELRSAILYMFNPKGAAPAK